MSKCRQRIRSAPLPAGVVDSYGAAAVLGTTRPERVARILGQVRKAAGSTADRPLYYVEDVERVAASRRLDPGQVTAAMAMEMLGVATPSRADRLLKASGIQPVGRVRIEGRWYVNTFPRAAVERLAAERATPAAVKARAAEQAQEAADRYDRLVVLCGPSDHYEEPPPPPVVKYDLLTFADVEALEKRWAKRPDWRPRQVA